jgi:DNA-binding CsgD family transcriptional regulator
MADLLLAAVEAIYDAAPDPSRWPYALQAIANVFGDVGAILIWRRDDGKFGTVVSESLFEAQKDYDESGWSTRELRGLRTAERGFFFSGEAFTDRHVCSDHEILTDPVYTTFLKQHGLGWFGAIAVSPDPHVGVALSIQRNSGLKPPFSDSELAIVERLGRHAEKSLRLSIRLLDAELANLGLGEALARVGIAVFALDSLGRVVFSNPAAKALPSSQIAIKDGQLRFGAGAARASIAAAITRTLKGERDDLVADPKPIVLHRSSSERPLVLYVLPIATRMRAVEQFLTHTRAIVLVIDPKADDPADPALVRDVLGLTLGEARVAALVGSGLPPREAAVRLGIGEETARTALKCVFSKVGVSRQSELTALLTKLVLR